MSEESGGRPRWVKWVIWLALLGGVNLASYIFDWSFWIY